MTIQNPEAPIEAQVFTCDVCGKRDIPAYSGSCGNFGRPHQAVKQTHCFYCCMQADLRSMAIAHATKKSFVAYISSDEQSLQGWLSSQSPYGAVTHKHPTNRRSPHGKVMYYEVRDRAGHMWFGYSMPGMCITLRPKKAC